MKFFSVFLQCLIVSTSSALLIELASHSSRNTFAIPQVDTCQFQPLGHFSTPSASRLHLHHRVTEEDSTFNTKGNDKIPLVKRSNTRREWIGQVVTGTSSISAAALFRPQLSLADTATIATLSPTTSSALCDPSVSTFKKNNRIINILGSAHISSESAQLAGRLVREVAPKAVFVELDQKRVKGIVTSSSDGETEATTIDSDFKTFSTTDSTSISKPTTEPMQSNNLEPKKTNPFDFREMTLKASSKFVGNAIRGMYQKLGDNGFSAGEEFVIAVKEGLAIESAIILGDQDVDVTLRRLTEALSKTDIKKLLGSDSEMEQNMKEFLPENVSNGGEMSKEQFSSFVETMKTKENTRLLMSNLKLIAPEIYEAMVGERDRYMANGLKKLDQFESIVAVMGIAHVDGVENNLRADGWVEVPARCPMVVK